MRLRSSGGIPSFRRGASAVELAILLPFLAFVFVIAVDFARVYYHHLTITNAARNGALYASQGPTQSTNTAGIRAVALDDTSNLSPAPNVSSTTGTDADGHPYVEVTVTWTFNTITNYPGVPSSMDITRTIRMRVAPLAPQNS